MKNHSDTVLVNREAGVCDGLVDIRANRLRKITIKTSADNTYSFLLFARNLVRWDKKIIISLIPY